jgi:hypothetical protein
VKKKKKKTQKEKKVNQRIFEGFQCLRKKRSAERFSEKISA